MPVRGDFEEGFQIFGEMAASPAVFCPGFTKRARSSVFPGDRQYHRPLGEDAYTYKLQIEGFADTILHGTPQHGAIDDGLPRCGRWWPSPARSKRGGCAVRGCLGWGVRYVIRATCCVRLSDTQHTKRVQYVFITTTYLNLDKSKLTKLTRIRKITDTFYNRTYATITYGDLREGVKNCCHDELVSDPFPEVWPACA